jgi:UDP-N-acetylglucosamine enolpyruvyl transferase
MGALLARFNKLPCLNQVVCIIGVRPIDTHLDAFSQLGVNIKRKRKSYF